MENYIFWSFMLIAFLLLVLLRKVSATISGPRLKAVPPPITPSAEDALERSALEPTSQSHSAKDAQTVSTDTEWFYVSGGSRHGPLSQAALVELIRSDAVPADTIVWHHEMKEWKPAKETELKKFLPLEQTNDETPPPIPSSAVNNTLAWLMALVPFAAGFFLNGDILRGSNSRGRRGLASVHRFSYYQFNNG